MASRYEDFAPDNVYHICSRSVEGRDLFLDISDRYRFLDLLTHSLVVGKMQSYSIVKRQRKKIEKPAIGDGLVDLLCYCLMTNHIHLLVKENAEGGITLYMQRLLNSYAKYFNTRRNRIGSLFVRPFRAVWVDDDDQLLHVSRYIHLNPYVAHMVSDPLTYRWSSLQEYVGRRSKYDRCHTDLIREMLNPQEHKAFITDEADYSQELGDIKHLLLEDEEYEPYESISNPTGLQQIG